MKKKGTAYSDVQFRLCNNKHGIYQVYEANFQCKMQFLTHSYVSGVYLTSAKIVFMHSVFVLQKRVHDTLNLVNSCLFPISYAYEDIQQDIVPRQKGENHLNCLMFCNIIAQLKFKFCILLLHVILIFPKKKKHNSITACLFKHFCSFHFK